MSNPIIPFPEPPPGGFRTVVADPPWQFGNRATRAAAEKHYEALPNWEVMFLEVERLVADEAHLYLWTTDSHLPYALSVARTWGFVYTQVVEWLKVNSEGRPQMGLGNYFRHSREMCLFCTRGKAAPLFKVHDQIDFFWAPRHKHSEKPAMFYDIVERCSPGPYFEMFARSGRPGWVSWGDQLNSAREEAA